MIGVLEVVGQDRDGNSDRLGSGNAFYHHCGMTFLMRVNLNIKQIFSSLQFSPS